MQNKKNNRKYEKNDFYLSLELVSVKILANPASCRCNFCQRIDFTQAHHAGDQWSPILSLHQQLRHFPAFFTEKNQIFRKNRKKFIISKFDILTNKIFWDIKSRGKTQIRAHLCISYILFAEMDAKAYQGVIGYFPTFSKFRDFWRFSENPQNVLWKWHTHQMKRLA